MEHYESRSSGGWIFGVAGLLFAVGVVVALTVGPEQNPGGLPGLLILLVALVVANFGVLTVRVGRDHVRWRFGLGPFGRRIALERVRSVETRRDPWYWGWGIRWTPRGWLWRASGLDAVWLELDHGRWVGVGTDDPDGLVRALRERLGQRG